MNMSISMCHLLFVAYTQTSIELMWQFNHATTCWVSSSLCVTCSPTLRSVGVCVSEDSAPSTLSAGSLLVTLFLGTCAMLVKETGITVFGVCMLYDALVLCRKPLFK